MGIDPEYATKRPSWAGIVSKRGKTESVFPNDVKIAERHQSSMRVRETGRR